MKNSLIGLTLLSAIMFFLPTCNKEPRIEVNTVSDFARQYFCNFADDSYWIYKNSANTVDSTRVTHNDITLLDGNTQHFLVYIRSKLWQGSNDIQWNVMRRVPGDTNYLVIMCDLPYGPEFRSYIVNEEFIPLENENTKIQKLSTYQINNFTFNDAIRISAADNDSLYLVFAKNVGIVEKRVKANVSAYKLTEYKLN